MVNKQLVEYIKTHHGKGHSYKDLHDHLVKHGYSSNEVNEAISNVTHSPHHHPARHKKEKKTGKRKAKGIAAVLFAAAVLFVILLVFAGPSKVDCGMDMDCFIEAAADCTPAKVRFTASADIFGMVTSATSAIEIQGEEEGKCIYYDVQESAEVDFSAETVESMMSSGLTMEEIAEQENRATESVRQINGIGKKCRFAPEELAEMLERWQEGTFSGGVSCSMDDAGEPEECTFSGDFADAECEIVS